MINKKKVVKEMIDQLEHQVAIIEINLGFIKNNMMLHPELQDNITKQISQKELELNATNEFLNYLNNIKL